MPNNEQAAWLLQALLRACFRVRTGLGLPAACVRHECAPYLWRAQELQRVWEERTGPVGSDGAGAVLPLVTAACSSKGVCALQCTRTRMFAPRQSCAARQPPASRVCSAASSSGEVAPRFFSSPPFPLQISQSRTPRALQRLRRPRQNKTARRRWRVCSLSARSRRKPSPFVPRLPNSMPRAPNSTPVPLRRVAPVRRRCCA